MYGLNAHLTHLSKKKAGYLFIISDKNMSPLYLTALI